MAKRLFFVPWQATSPVGVAALERFAHDGVAHVDAPSSAGISV
ncbi:hypothetical protein [Sphingomonas panacis]|nr:hypothetical protein [Sphingomonas panacis]